MAIMHMVLNLAKKMKMELYILKKEVYSSFKK